VRLVTDKSFLVLFFKKELLSSVIEQNPLGRPFRVVILAGFQGPEEQRERATSERET
jgi:hypothetical protein